VGNKIGICPKERDDWVGVANLWGLTIARPGFLKSPAASEVLKPLRRAAFNASTAYTQLAETYELDLAIYKRNRQKAIDGGGEPTDPPPEKPRRRVYLTNDSTYQKLGEMLVDNPHGILLHRDEIVGLLRAMVQEQNVEAKTFLMQAWDGKNSYTMDRIGRGHVHIEHACISFFGTMQPGAISEFVRHAVVGGREDDGLIQRFGLTAWPDTASDWKNVDEYPNRAARDAAYAVFDGLDALTPEGVGAEQGQYDEFPYLRFTPEAQKLFLSWREKLEPRVRGGDLPEAVQSHLSKYRGLIPALALITHLIDVGKGPVGEMALLKALLWAEYLEPHALRLYSAGVQPTRAAAKVLLARLRDGQLQEAPSFTRRDVYQPGWSGLATASLRG
jgi:putative DNA primase/helicase